MDKNHFAKLWRNSNTGDGDKNIIATLFITMKNCKQTIQKFNGKNEHMNRDRIKYCTATKMNDVDETQSPHRANG